ncbi:thiolase family protein [Sphingomonas solaris]|uniref:Thiolase family protein n=1 Tax=Alterirhizorhabdus solaris TaxID=2529389 RepID=A0A558RBJ5_9SPHN|nr:thiolase family protein [Sphingomonas solaris]TVV76723.1 thiolase family protein [Sphingomonas solaris]
MSIDRYPEKQVRITGIGQSEVGRPSRRTALALTMDACLEAIAEAGLKPSDIDGITTYPGPIADPKGFSPVGATETMIALGLEPTWVGASAEGHAHMGAIFSAIQAIASGLCRHVLIFRTVAQASAAARSNQSAGQANLMGGNKGSARVGGGMAWSVPFNAISPITVNALYAQAYFDKYGATSAQLGAIAVNGRKMAALNPKAVFRDKPLTIEDYLASRLISTPLRLYDCDIPVDGSTAILLSHKDVAGDLAQPPIEIESMGMSLGGLGVGRHVGDFTSFPSDKAGEMLWSRTDLTPADVDVAQIYDGFSILTLLWLESMKLCGRGEAAAFVEGGTRIGLDGELPLNTSGGQLSAGRLHGYGHTYEACLQLWGRAGDRQVTDAKVCAVSNGGFGYGALLLKRG